MSSGGNTNSNDQLRSFFADELKKAQATSRRDTEEVERLRGIEVEYLADEKVWNRERKRLEDDLNSKITAFEKVQREKVGVEKENARLTRDLGEQESLTRDAVNKCLSLENQKEIVDDKLADALKKALEEETRANSLNFDLEEARETCREAQEKTDSLTSRPSMRMGKHA
jgi:chromosome segregation ATPase